MPHRLARFDALVEGHLETARDGCPEVQAEQMRAEVRRFLDHASLGWSTRQAMLRQAEDRMAAAREAG